ncbi:hypothetical protein K470DRAFT_263219 [Piedraia hortae CBS 480.64]|uniref:Uncharacterized protein n=1 Tax=Piedraia hortae CBS 480.64 TaxID=1314780 RepID=A0A6A7C3R5_9PEZI|nr:hypothetical protein K470DRAFT_263219 [Piedraia hortae CBS 480.64]
MPNPQIITQAIYPDPTMDGTIEDHIRVADPQPHKFSVPYTDGCVESVSAVRNRFMGREGSGPTESSISRSSINESNRSCSRCRSNTGSRVRDPYTKKQQRSSGTHSQYDKDSHRDGYHHDGNRVRDSYTKKQQRSSGTQSYHGKDSHRDGHHHHDKHEHHNERREHGKHHHHNKHGHHGQHHHHHKHNHYDDVQYDERGMPIQTDEERAEAGAQAAVAVINMIPL